MTGVTCGFDEFDLLLRARPHPARSAGVGRSVVHVASVHDESTISRPLSARLCARPRTGGGVPRALAQIRGARQELVPFLVQADLNTVSMCQVRASRSGRSLRCSGTEIVCPTRSRS